MRMGVNYEPVDEARTERSSVADLRMEDVNYRTLSLASSNGPSLLCKQTIVRRNLGYWLRFEVWPGFMPI